ncbi:resistance protein [Musa troglodytarum]|uniref:Resistance protein n=1 Tax=Musa troglodytarum TaxID=320322 RepID=A0A9E7L8Z7_9LILI|nr:resistance protein [Musa troglodytarum]
MAVSADLKFVLLEILPTPALMAQGRELRIQNHLEMVHDCIWALNAVIIGALMRALKEPAVEEWVNDVGIAVADVEDLLRSILGRQPRSGGIQSLAVLLPQRRRSSIAPCYSTRARGEGTQAELRREEEGSSLCLRKEMMDSTYPRREEEEEKKKESFAISREEVVGRDKEVEKIINKIHRKRQQRSNYGHDDDGGGGGDDYDDDVDVDDDDDDDDELWFFILCGKFMVGKTSIARMVYHHPWVCQHFGHRVWIDGSKLSSFDTMRVIKEFMRLIAGEPCEDIWLSYDRFGGSHRCFLVIDHFLIGLDEQDKSNQLVHFLLLMGEPGSLVMMVISDYNLENFFFKI